MDLRVPQVYREDKIRSVNQEVIKFKTSIVWRVSRDRLSQVAHASWKNGFKRNLTSLEKGFFTDGSFDYYNDTSR